MLALFAVSVTAQFLMGTPASAQVPPFPALPPWVALEASAPYQLVGGTANLTATSSIDVTYPNPYYIEIFDQTDGTRVAVCGSGRTCSGLASYSNSTTHNYIAYIAKSGMTNPPPQVQAESRTVTVSWQNTLVLNGPSLIFGVHGTAILTATSSIDVTYPNPYYIEIFDETNGTLRAVCGSGTTCSVSSVTYDDRDHTFIAYVSRYGTTYPPPEIQATSNSFTVQFEVIK
jgi:hypothetical protein